MKTKAGLFLVAALLIGAGGNDSSAKKEIAKFAGTWTVKDLTYNGQDGSKYRFKLTFKGDVATVEGDEEIKSDYARLKIKLDPSATPKIIDFTVAGGSQKDASIEGIYEFKDKELRICAKVFGKDRPSEFTSPEGSSIVLIVLKRAD